MLTKIFLKIWLIAIALTFLIDVYHNIMWKPLEPLVKSYAMHVAFGLGAVILIIRCITPSKWWEF